MIVTPKQRLIVKVRNLVKCMFPLWLYVEAELQFFENMVRLCLIAKSSLCILNICYSTSLIATKRP
jgi:hypothetical protein